MTSFKSNQAVLDYHYEKGEDGKLRTVWYRVRGEVTLTVDMDRIMLMLASKALISTGKKARFMKGAIIAKASNVTRTKTGSTK